MTLTFKNAPLPGIQIYKYDKDSKEPLAGATFEIRRDGQVLQTVKTDVNGYAKVYNLPKGFYQVDAKYTGALLRGCTRGGKAGMSCYDMLMTVAPCNLVTIGSLLLAVLLCVTSFAQPAYITYRVMRMLGRILMLTVRGITFSLFAFGAVTMIAEWKRIAGPAWKKVLYTFTFPLFMLTYVPISIAALVGKVEWKPIQHGIAKVQEERESA